MPVVVALGSNTAHNASNSFCNQYTCMSESRQHLFDQWADHYNPAGRAAFPFIGYEQVIEYIYRCADCLPGMEVLDIGTGTGTLAGRFAAGGCRVWAVDYSARMLEIARAKFPDVVFAQGDITQVLPAEIPHRYNRIVSSYVLHECSLPAKVEILCRLAQDHLREGGAIIVGDIAFETVQAREEARQRWQDKWDDDEYYWAADETAAAFAGTGVCVDYRQISECAGVFIVRKQSELID